MIELIALLFIASGAQSEATKARAVFDEIQEHATEYDPGISSFYADDAVITASRDERAMSLNGAQYAKLVELAMPVAKTRGDRSSFSNIRVEPVNGVWRIRADRYSHLRCYTDDSYSMDLAQRDGKWVIVAEHITARSVSRCADARAKALATAAMALSEQLPLDVDADSRLLAVDVDGDTLAYRYSLHNTVSGRLNAKEFAAAIRSHLIATACADRGSKNLLLAGARLRYRYFDKESAEVANVELLESDCQ